MPGAVLAEARKRPFQSVARSVKGGRSVSAKSLGVPIIAAAGPAILQAAHRFMRHNSDVAWTIGTDTGEP